MLGPPLRLSPCPITPFCPTWNPPTNPPKPVHLPAAIAVSPPGGEPLGPVLKVPYSMCGDTRASYTRTSHAEGLSIVPFETTGFLA